MLTSTLAFFSTRLGKILLGVFGFVVVVLWFNAWAESNGKYKCVGEVQAASLEEMQRQVDAARRAQGADRQRALEAIKKSEDYEKRIREFERQNAEAPDADTVCVTADDVERLLDLERDPED